MIKIKSSYELIDLDNEPMAGLVLTYTVYGSGELRLDYALDIRHIIKPV